ncbi:MAG: hypothetical protein WD767_18720 [Alphaproteobacteria bacterium]
MAKAKNNFVVAHLDDEVSLKLTLNAVHRMKRRSVTDGHAVGSKEEEFMDYWLIWSLAPLVLLLSCYLGRRREQSLDTAQEAES